MVLGLFVGPDDDALISKNSTNSQGHGQRAPGMIRRVVVAAVDDYGIITFHVFGKHHQLTSGQLLKSPSQGQIARITGRIPSLVCHGASSFQSLAFGSTHHAHHQHCYDAAHDAEYDADHPRRHIRSRSLESLDQPAGDSLWIRATSLYSTDSISLTEDYGTERISRLEWNAAGAGVEHCNVERVAVIGIYFQIRDNQSLGCQRCSRTNEPQYFRPGRYVFTRLENDTGVRLEDELLVQPV